jgi:glycosyltransferase involved in cell wall biosynthesis
VTRALSYAVITPVRTEAQNLARLAASIDSQTHLPTRWVIVDNGSEDTTLEVARKLAQSRAWVTVISVPGETKAVPGAPIVRAFHAGLRELPELPDIVVKLDADTSMDPDHFERLTSAFIEDGSLGIASGTCLEPDADGAWQPYPVALGHVRGAVRAYRRECLEAVLPLEERVGWDGIDGWKAQLNGWETRMLPQLGFYHHRRVGARDGTRVARWRTQGNAAWFMGYRFSYLLLRSIHRSRRDVAALAMVTGYLGAALRREPRYHDPDVRAYVRRLQRLRTLAGQVGAGRQIRTG